MKKTATYLKTDRVVFLLGWAFFILLAFPSFSQQTLFEHFTTKEGLGSNNVYDIAITQNGDIWAVTDQHLCKFEGLSFSKNNLNDSSIIGIALTNKENIVVYTSSGNIYQFNDSKFSPLILPKEISIATSLINKIQYEETDAFWISTIISKNCYRISKKEIENYRLEKECAYFLKELPNNKFIWGTGTNPIEFKTLWVEFLDKSIAIPFTKKGAASKSLFIKLSNGKYLFSKDFEVLLFDENGIISRVFVEKNIQSLFQDSKNKIWIGLNNGGVICYPNGEITSKNTITYLGNKNITAITEDFSENIWVSTTNNGIYYLPNQQAITYSPPHLFSDSSKENIVAEGIVTKTPQNTPESAINERAVKVTDINHAPPVVYINGLKIMGKDTVILPEYELEHDHNSFKIKYIGFARTDAEHIQYTYKMYGLDKDWTFTNNTSVQYTTLPPGKYKFIVNSMNKNGVWAKNPATIKFIIKPPFWVTWWFLLLSVISVVLSIGIGMYLWIKNIKEKERKKSIADKKLATIELQALRAQMNPHFMFNTMSSIQHYITLNESDSALRYLSKFSRLMRKILDNSQQSTISVKNEIESLTLYLELESLRFKDKLAYKIAIDESVDVHFDEIPSMLIQPYVENAILHGISHKKEKGLVTIKLSRTATLMTCLIIDDGIGRENSRKINQSKNKQHKSKGMSITQERLNILNVAYSEKMNVIITDLKDKNNAPSGTKVEIRIPVID